MDGNNAPSSPTHPKEKVWAVLSIPRIMPSMSVARAGVLSTIGITQSREDTDIELR